MAQVALVSRRRAQVGTVRAYRDMAGPTEAVLAQLDLRLCTGWEVAAREEVVAEVAEVWAAALDVYHRGTVPLVASQSWRLRQ